MSAPRTIRAQDLVYTTNYVEGDMPIGDVKTWFQTQLSVISLGVLLGDGKFSLITRTQLYQLLMGNEKQTAFLSQPISEVLSHEPLTVEGGMELDKVVGKLIEEKNGEDDFFNDIIVHDHGAFVGLLSVRDLLINHVESLTHMLTAMEAQQQALARKNKELFASSFRMGQMEGHYKLIFENVPLPLALFNERGEIVTGNPVFMDLLQIDRQSLRIGAPFNSFFQQDYSRVRSLAVRNWEQGLMEDSKRYCVLNARLLNGQELTVGCYFDLLPDGRQVLMTFTPSDEVLTPESPAQPAPEQHESDITPTRSVQRAGKVTQAIRTKLSSENTVGLARTVAANLIDRGGNVDDLMRKLDTIVKVAEQIETVETTPSSANEMKGSISEFSVIDLCQILVQGTKTGCLMLFQDHAQQPIGRLYLYVGNIVHAEHADGTEGADALPILMQMRSGSFRFCFGESSPQVTIEGDAMGILMNACQAADEGQR